MYEVGDEPGIGIYECLCCHNKIEIDNEETSLPYCPHCKSDCYYIRKSYKCCSEFRK